MHPGPVNRGVELAAEVIDSPQALITEQVESGVVVRMAVLYELLAGRRRPGGRPHPDETTDAAARMSAARARPRARSARHAPDPGRRARRPARGPRRRRATCSCATGAWPSSGDGLEAPRRAPRWWTPRACTRCPPSWTRTCTCARPGREDEEDVDSGTARRGRRRLLRDPRHAQHRSGGGLGARSCARCASAPAPRPGSPPASSPRSPAASAARSSPRWPSSPSAGAAGFTDDGLPVRSAGVMRQALQYQRLAGRPLALHEEDPTLSGRRA